MNREVPKKITVAGIRLEYLEIQPRLPCTEPPLLLLHGLLATAETLVELIDNLPKDRRIVALDLFSAAPEDPSGKLDVHSAALAELIGGFAQSIGLDRPVLIGHSYGGTLALWFSAAHGNQIRGLVLLCPAHPFGGYRSHVVAFYLTRWGRFLALSIPLAPRFLILRAYNEAAGPAKPITVAHLRPYLRVLRHRGKLRRVLQMLHTWEADMSHLRRALLSSPVIQPVLLIWGDRDVVVPPSSAAALGRCMPASECVMLPGKGHLLVEEAPGECGSLIEAWLARLDSGTCAPQPPVRQAAGSSPNSSDTQPRIAVPSMPSFDSGD